MPRVSEIDSDRGEPTLQPIFAREREVFGEPLNPTKVYAHRPLAALSPRRPAQRVSVLNRRQCSQGAAGGRDDGQDP